MNAEVTYTPSFSGGGCLSTGALRQYIDGTLPRHNLHAVEKHLLDCDFCSHVLEDMDVSEHAVPDIATISRNVNARISELVGSAPKPSFWSSYGTFLKTGTVLLLLIGGVALYRFQTQAGTSAPPKTFLPPVTEHPFSSGESAGTPASTTPDKTPFQDEFSGKATAIQPGTEAFKSPPPSPVASQPDASPSSEPSVAAPIDPKPVEVTVVSPVKNEEPMAAPAMEKENNITSLQIVSVKVLQKMTKTSGGSRKSGKNGQLSSPTDKNAAYYLMEDMPQFPGGDEAMEEYLVAKFKNPVKDKRTLTGKAVGVIFTVSSRGKISDVEITHSISPELDVEILRLVSEMPRWIPGKHLVGDITCVLAFTVR